ncbi:MAG: DNA polymerase III subunit delta [Eubacteriales bacterium]|nr:DNA polymerase III subunit delta [Eubacteriales bacterium]
MKSLNEDIKKGQFKNVYLLYGEEDYLKKQYKGRLTNAMLPEGDTVNYAYFEGKGIPVAQMIDLAETMPFFAERRLIVVENSGLFKGSASELAEYIKTMPETACFLFVENEVDKRGKLYKAVKDKGRIVELGRQDERTLVLWLLGMMKQEKKRVQESTVRYILSKTGTDMENLEKEMEKLFCYTLDRDEITVQDVDAVCTTQITNRIFEMVEAVAKQEKKKALDYYYDLLALKEPPMRILFLLTRQFKLLLEVQNLLKKGMSRKQIAEEAGLHPFVAGKYMEQCRNFREADLRAIMEEGVNLETDVKTGRLSDVMSVEIFILSSLSRGSKNRG